MAIVAAGALALTGCTSDTGDDGGDSTTDSTTDTDAGEAGDDETETDDGEAGGSTEEPADSSKVDLGDITTRDDVIVFSTGAEQYNAYNLTGATNSTYNAVVNRLLGSGFIYWGTDGTIYPNEFFGSWTVDSEEPLTITYTISDEAVWSDGVPVTANDYLLDWAATNPEALGGADTLGFDAISDSFGVFVPEGLETEVDSKTFTITYPDPYPDWQLMVGAPVPAHVAAEQSDVDPGELAQAILDGDGETVSKVSDFWNTGWNFPDYTISDPALYPSMGPYTLDGAIWQVGESLTLQPNTEFWGPAPATSNIRFQFTAPEAHVQALENSDINVIEPQATMETVQQIENMGDSVSLLAGDSLTWEHLDYNFAEDSPFAEDNGGLAAREAFAYCVPRAQIVENLIVPINENAEIMNLREKFPFQPDYQEVLSAAYDGRYDEVNLDEAKAKFEESGLEDGTTIRIGYSAPNQRRTDEVAAIKASCDEVGFVIEDAGDGSFFEEGGPLDRGDWEVALFAWAGSGQIASGRPIYSTGGGQNYGGFSNETVDEAWGVLATSVDPEVHLEQIKIIEKELWDNLYGLPIFAHPRIVGYESAIENVRLNSVQTGISWNAEQWVRAQ